ncbi:homoserine dehydrogenase [Fructobacillus pseudoficulneus]|uniref:Homoserine dehydrogenase n=1 Tax=Fructobacillus pseudoficulneus TaxID=220714 RepID=A0A3F3H6N7_9LACO|nr:homoserine dehydrogenase [Fructobacillus pseudoficulneus]GAP02213.1 homoserine dehydrogenase [Fructobacillus pseudoficulneus]SEH36082.1 homoserine dehydrogenase [Fructobacillus pseudoficulneus]
MTIKIGLFGLGTVGSGLLTLLAEQNNKIKASTGLDFTVKTALVSTLTKDRPGLDPAIQLTTDPNDILNDPEIDLVVEVAGGTGSAKGWIKSALSSKKPVITANKDLIATAGQELIELANKAQVPLLYEAAVAGGIPIITTLQNYYRTDTIRSLAGIVNGTTNYMLTQMAQNGLSYEKALKQAQELGFAEADPTNDVAGYDAAYKAIILARLVFGLESTLDELAITGIQEITDDDIAAVKVLGGQLKLLFTINQVGEDSIALSVSPQVILPDSPLSQVHNENNAIVVNSDNLGQTMYYGPGAGARPTAQAVLADILLAATATKESHQVFSSENMRLAEPNVQAYCWILNSKTHESIESAVHELDDELNGYIVRQGSHENSNNGSQLVLYTKEITTANHDRLLKELTQKRTLNKEFVIYPC